MKYVRDREKLQTHKNSQEKVRKKVDYLNNIMSAPIRLNG